MYLTFANGYERAPETFELLEGDRDAIEREIGVRLSRARLEAARCGAIDCWGWWVVSHS